MPNRAAENSVPVVPPFVLTEFKKQPLIVVVAFMLNDTTLAAFKKLTIGTNDDRPLWQPSVREGEPDRIEGYKYFINNDMPAMTTGLKSMLFGNFDKYAIRQVGSYIMGRSDERYFEERAVAFSLFARFDGRYLDTAAVKHLIEVQDQLPSSVW